MTVSHCNRRLVIKQLKAELATLLNSTVDTSLTVNFAKCTPVGAMLTIMRRGRDDRAQSADTVD